MGSPNDPVEFELDASPGNESTDGVGDEAIAWKDHQCPKLSGMARSRCSRLRRPCCVFWFFYVRGDFSLCITFVLQVDDDSLKEKEKPGRVSLV